MSFADTMKSDAAASILDFGEGVVYKPYSGSPRPIKAIVDRQAPQDVAGMPASVMQLTVVNDSLLGIEAKELNLGGDRVGVAKVLGHTLADHMIAGPPISADAGALVLWVGLSR